MICVIIFFINSLISEILEVFMSWNEVRTVVLEHVPVEIEEDPNRLNDFLKGAEEAYKLLNNLFQDDLK